jgi:hypothetical protein
MNNPGISLGIIAILIILKKFLTYFSISLLILRGVLWYSSQRVNDDIEIMGAEADKLILQADSLDALRIMAANDSNRQSDLKRKERQLLIEALNRQLSAEGKVKQQSIVLNALEITGNILLGLAIVGLLIITFKER